jgi:hypothetical protein
VCLPTGSTQVRHAGRPWISLMKLLVDSYPMTAQFSNMIRIQNKLLTKNISLKTHLIYGKHYISTRAPRTQCGSQVLKELAKRTTMRKWRITSINTTSYLINRDTISLTTVSLSMLESLIKEMVQIPSGHGCKSSQLLSTTTTSSGPMQGRFIM